MTERGGRNCKDKGNLPPCTSLSAEGWGIPCGREGAKPLSTSQKNFRPPQGVKILSKTSPYKKEKLLGFCAPSVALVVKCCKNVKIDSIYRKQRTFNRSESSIRERSLAIRCNLSSKPTKGDSMGTQAYFDNTRSRSAKKSPISYPLGFSLGK